MAADAGSWRDAHREWTRACARRDDQVGRVRKRLVRATGGLGLGRWQAALDRQRFRTIADAKLKAQALRTRPAVAAALEELDRTAVEADAEVAVAAARLAERSRRLLRYGNLATLVTGMPIAQLRRLAST